MQTLIKAILQGWPKNKADSPQEITLRIHSSHLGVEGCLRRARECVYWQGMNEPIKSNAQQCNSPGYSQSNGKAESAVKTAQEIDA